MIIFLLCFLAFCFYKSKFFGLKEFNRDYIAQENTTAVNGIFVGLIIMGHYVQYYSEYGALDMPYIEVRSFLGQMVVSMFFIYSGYGIYESFKKKGSGYIKSFPKNRMLKLLLHLDYAVIIFWAVFLILGRKVSLQQFLLSLIGWEYIGNNNWFVFATLIFYLITFVSFLLLRKRKAAPLIAVTLLTVVYIIVIKEFKPTFWYNSAVCFPFGMWYSYFKERTERVIMKNNAVYFSSLFLSLAVFIGFRCFFGGFAYLTTYLFSCIFFGLTVILITMKLKFGNRALIWLGKHAFSIYMLQRIPMVVLYDLGVLAKYPHICFAVSFAVVIIISALFDRLTVAADKKLFAGKSELKTA